MQHYTMSFKQGTGAGKLKWVNGSFEDTHPNPSKELKESKAAKYLIKDGWLVYGGPMIDKTISK